MESNYKILFAILFVFCFGCKKPSPRLEKLITKDLSLDYLYDNNNELLSIRIYDIKEKDSTKIILNKSSRSIDVVADNKLAISYNLDSLYRIKSFKIDDIGLNDYSEKTLSYDNLGRLINLKEQKFINRGFDLFSTTNIKLRYDGDNPIRIADELGTFYLITYYEPQEIKFENKDMLWRQLNYVEIYPNIYSKEAIGRIPNRLIKSITVTYKNIEDVRSQYFKYETNNAGYINKVVITKKVKNAVIDKTLKEFDSYHYSF